MFFMVKKEKRPVSLLKKLYSFNDQDELSLTYPVKWIQKLNSLLSAH